MLLIRSCFFFFNDTATTEIYTLSLHDALPISEILFNQKDYGGALALFHRSAQKTKEPALALSARYFEARCLERSEEHTSELQSRQYLVCRLLLEKKK